MTTHKKMYGCLCRRVFRANFCIHQNLPNAAQSRKEACHERARRVLLCAENTLHLALATVLETELAIGCFCSLALKDCDYTNYVYKLEVHEHAGDANSRNGTLHPQKLERSRDKLNSKRSAPLRDTSLPAARSRQRGKQGSTAGRLLERMHRRLAERSAFKNGIHKPTLPVANGTGVEAKRMDRPLPRPEITAVSLLREITRPMLSAKKIGVLTDLHRTKLGEVCR